MGFEWSFLGGVRVRRGVRLREGVDVGVFMRQEMATMAGRVGSVRVQRHTSPESCVRGEGFEAACTSGDTRQALTVALVKPGRGAC